MPYPVGGDYGFKEELEKLIDEYDLNYKIVFHGVLTGEDKLDALADCDIFAIPSRYGSFTTSGLEAMVCSKPLILTKKTTISIHRLRTIWTLHLNLMKMICLNAWKHH